MSDLPALRPIGVARTARTSIDSTPVQSSLNRREEGVVEVDEQYVAGLEGLADFDYLWLVTWLGRGSAGAAATADPAPGPDSLALRQVPYLLRPEGREMGVFATRGPRRVNPIGLSLVRLVDISGRSVRFAGVDLVDGTPILDLKPYVAAFDRPPGEPRSGWFDTVAMPDAVTPGDLKPPTG